MRRRVPAPAYRAICLGLPCLIVLALFAFPGSAGQDPTHVHIVVGGTPAARARALELHLLYEREGIDAANPLVAAFPLGTRRAGSAAVRVLSIRGDGEGGAAVLTIDRSGFTILTAIPPVSVPTQTSRVAAVYPPSRVPQPALSTPDPPPRRAQARNPV